MKIKTVRKWSESAGEKRVKVVAALIVALMLGLYGYMGYLITLL